MKTDEAGIIQENAARHPRGHPGCINEDDWQFARALDECTCQPGNQTTDEMNQQSINHTLWRNRAPAGMTSPAPPDGGYPTPH